MATINRTVGFKLDGEKCYHCYTLAGDCYLIRPSGNKWRIEGHPGEYKLKRDAQDAIATNKVKSPVLGAPQEIGPQEPDLGTSHGTWECIHPCALLVLFGKNLASSEEFQEAVKKTLEAYSWSENGVPDEERAFREFRWDYPNPCTYNYSQNN